jgi:hypothetical protein
LKNETAADEVKKSCKATSINFKIQFLSVMYGEVYHKNTQGMASISKKIIFESGSSALQLSGLTT